MTKTQNKIYGYIRVSTDKQTLENQRYEINRYCEEHNLTVDQWFEDDGVSGTVDFHKRNLNQLFKQLKEDDMIICSELSRLGRSLYMIFDIMKYLQNKKIKLHTIKENFTLDDSVTSKVLVFAFGLSSEIEIEMIRQRTKEGLALRKAQGIKLGRPIGSHNKEHRLHKYHDRIMNYIHNNRSRYYMCKHLSSNSKSINTYLRVIKDEIPKSKHAFYNL